VFYGELDSASVLSARKALDTSIASWISKSSKSLKWVSQIDVNSSQQQHDQSLYAPPSSTSPLQGRAKCFVFIHVDLWAALRGSADAVTVEPVPLRDPRPSRHPLSDAGAVRAFVDSMIANNGQGRETSRLNTVQQAMWLPGGTCVVFAPDLLRAPSVADETNAVQIGYVVFQ
jgi:hypothetical protein